MAAGHLRDLRSWISWNSEERVFWKCSATLDSSTLIQRSSSSDAESEEKSKELSVEERDDNNNSTDLRWSKVWLFGSRDRHIDFILSADCAAFELAGFLLSSPLGRIVGKSPGTCDVTD